MPASKRTGKGRRIQRRAVSAEPTEPPIIESLPVRQHVYYAGLGFLDWAAEGATQLTKRLRVVEKQLVDRGRSPSTTLAKRLEVGCADLTRRGAEFRSSTMQRVQDIWAAMRGTPGSDKAKTA